MSQHKIANSRPFSASNGSLMGAKLPSAMGQACSRVDRPHGARPLHNRWTDCIHFATHIRHPPVVLMNWHTYFPKCPKGIYYSHFTDGKIKALIPDPTDAKSYGWLGVDQVLNKGFATSLSVLFTAPGPEVWRQSFAWRSWLVSFVGKLSP